MVRVVDDKTGSESWIPLFDLETGAPLYAARSMFSTNFVTA